MSIRHKKINNIIIINRRHTLYTFTASVLGFEVFTSHPLDIALLRKSYNSILSWYKIFHWYIKLIKPNFRSSVISVFFGNNSNLFFYHSEKNLFIWKDKFEFIYFYEKFFMLILYLFSFQSGKSTKSHIYYSLGLSFWKTKPCYEFFFGFSCILAWSY